MLTCKVTLIAQLVKNPPAMQETLVRFLGWEDRWRRDRLPTPVFLGFPCGSAGKESARNAEDLGSIPGLGRSPGEGKGYPLQDSGLENSMDRVVHGVTKSHTRLKDFHFHSLLHHKPFGETGYRTAHISTCNSPAAKIPRIRTEVPYPHGTQTL